ncbi:ABC transporter ATP-binding protein [Mycoplasma sp. 1654_15]|uniref:ABC transporter ATP-binding protein n=1 Tax=Mycoplasma sp. 1654_15 TaxID=2725994 RepID=UPI00144965E3|nr:ABC transporter ATP-binding protein [Mycoplasma sp. 1654_15]QJB70936.1 ABC transporter ATP-binding protein [Mycoplasma sp. 1654_15]
MKKTILKVSNLNKIYKNSNRGVQDINFEVLEGEIHAFIGENGAGKTTIIKAIVDAYRNYQGDILINGFKNTTPEAKKFLGYVPEKSLFPKELKTKEYLLLLAQLSNLNKKQANQDIDKFLEALNIQDLASSKPYDFSSGQKRKIALIQALIHNPELIILDEPLANLDPTSRFDFIKIIQDLRTQGKTIFLSSHNLSEIDQIVDSVTLINKGKIYYTGAKKQNLNDLYYTQVIDEQIDEKN